MPQEKRDSFDSRNIEKNPDYYSVESDDEVFQMVKGILEETVFGQSHACEELARPITRHICGFNDPNKPMFVGMFLGEPGVGKTETGLAVAKIFNPLHPEQRLKIVDCNMFQHSHDIERILGAPPSYVGYGDEPFINKQFLSQPNVIVFDEIEKADTALHKLLLRIMDKARLDINESDSGEENPFMFMDMSQNMDGDIDFDYDLPGLDFSQSVLIMTSNIGSKEINDIKSRKGKIGFLPHIDQDDQKDIQATGIAAVEKFWKHMPEFINRLDSMVVFNSLTVEIVYKLIDKFLNEYFENQGRDGTYVMATEELKKWIISQMDVRKAGRELRRKISKIIMTPASEVKFKIPKGVPLIADISRDDPKRVIFWLSKTIVSSATKTNR